MGPTWDLSADETKELLKRLNDLPDADKVMEACGLGYHGFLITTKQYTLKTTQQHIQIYKKSF